MNTCSNLIIYLFLSILLSACTQNNVKYDESRLEKQVLCETLKDPMEIAITSDGRVFIIERMGIVKLYNPENKSTKIIARLKVDLGHEDGLLGLTIDPNFDTNNWIYLLYTPTPHRVQRVARFTFSGNKLDMASETIIIEYPIVPVRHQGGSLAFDGVGNLYISTGENTLPTGINGYAPLDERPTHEVSDAQRSAGNSNDLRGKILRIIPNVNGGYCIPKGNFKEKYNLAKARSEIFVMGCRNPFRIALDKKNQTLYWGEIGPDAGSDSEKGPKGHDEINRASVAGFYGWPYFTANNKAYSKVDFTINKVLSVFDTLHTENKSPNNTGDIYLPKPNPALIWYPYDHSKEFPILGKGGRTAMAGIVYHRVLHKQNYEMLPSYFENKLLIMDWMRNWIMTVSFEANGKLKNIEPFMKNTTFRRPMDMDLGNDGCVYVLEYGSNWFGNTDGTLSKINYNRNNRKPVINLTHTSTNGGLPFTVNFNTDGTLDLDNDSLSYEWTVYNMSTNQTLKLPIDKPKNPKFTFEKTGKYSVNLKVSDAKISVNSPEVVINVGNAPPMVQVNLSGNNTFYWDSRNINYHSNVADKEDGSNQQTTNSIEVIHSADLNNSIMPNSIFNRGKILVNNTDCKSCHAFNEKSVGPTFLEISKMYKATDENIDKLSQKVINGGSGVWGQAPMSAHPQLSNDQAMLMVRYLLSHSNYNNQPNIINPMLFSNITLDANTFIKIKSTYIDHGANGMASIQKSDSIILINPEKQALDYSTSSDIIETNGLARLPFPNSYISFNHIDLTDIISIGLSYNYDFFVPNCWLELRIGSPKGKIVGKIEIKKLDAGILFGLDNLEITPTNGFQNLFVIYKPALNLHAPVNIKSLKFKIKKNIN